MTGRIKSLSTGTASGVITAENGLSVYFPLSAVLAYDITCLAVGQFVTFDVGDGTAPSATNVYVRKQHQVTPTSHKHDQGAWLRYMGFDQSGSVRSYRFDRISAGEDNKTFVVTTDLGLFLRYHVGIQEGPALCLHLLSAELDRMGPLTWPLLQPGLTDRDMLAHLAHRPAGGKHGPRRTPGTSFAFFASRVTPPSVTSV